MAEQDADGAATTWRVFTGDGEPKTGYRLPPPPRWRTFPIPEAKTKPAVVYKAYPRLVNAINLAITLRRPLLLTGPAGVGKSTVAEAIARELALDDVLRWNVTSRSTLEEGLYRYDALGRLQHVQRTREDALQKFLRLGPLGTALSSPGQRVLLIDELDKSDIDLPGDLLNVLERGEFEIEELARHDTSPMSIRPADESATVEIEQGRVACSVFPIIVITSNGEREFPPAFLRRCIREKVEIPDAERLKDIVAAHLGDDLAGQAAALITDFATKIGSPDRPAALAIDQLLNTVLMMTREDAPTDGKEREQIIGLLQRELRES
ncbi:AAA family ATPase [Paractinoplanes globisporus]|uniref:AAA family ATPase n=1 Tax=Paractinoplanes globisporus TaxID=113565 RepID=A0ABW6WWA1_9ACTN|nr:MoxR family ATPase [Actinoplanes globisporus]